MSYIDKSVLGVPGSHLDSRVFNQDATFLDEAPFLRSLLENPNHIGCHTLGESEPFFSGTHDIERELLSIGAIDIFKAQNDMYDGYVASGGTEANINAIWIYRNYFQRKMKAGLENIVIICSQDTHYSIDKAANLLSLDITKIPVQENDRSINRTIFEEEIQIQKKRGKTCFILICNMMTTMFGSVDDIKMAHDVLESANVAFKVHVDAVYGGFYYPFAVQNNLITFENPHICSFSVDAHKVLQSPYGTGIFLVRKDMIQYANIENAKYVKGEDCTLVGSRSGANAIAIWMILCSYGREEWEQKIEQAQSKTSMVTDELDRLGVIYYRNPHANIIAMKNDFISKDIAKKYYLVPDNHASPSWQKIVVMEHVTTDQIQNFIEDLSASLKNPNI